MIPRRGLKADSEGHLGRRFGKRTIDSEVSLVLHIYTNDWTKRCVVDGTSAKHGPPLGTTVLWCFISGNDRQEVAGPTAQQC